MPLRLIFPRTKPDYSFEGAPELESRQDEKQGWRSVMSGSDWKERAEKVIDLLRGLVAEESCSEIFRTAARVELYVLEEVVELRRKDSSP